jgi:hypothetical protein
VKLTYASEEEKHTPSKQDKFYQVCASSKFGISRRGEGAGTARTPCVTLCALCTRTRITFTQASAQGQSVKGAITIESSVLVEAGVASSVPVGQFCG